MDLAEFRYYTAWHAAANERRYGAPADPWRLVRVPPGDVSEYTGAVALNWGLGRVEAGDWDDPSNRSPMREMAIHRGLRQRFADGRAWEDTALYDLVAERFAERDRVRGYDSLDEYREVRLAYLDDLYERVRDDGYRPNADAGHDRADEDNAFENAYANHLEPLVVVGREGDVVWTEGYHRFAIADVLGVEAVPVYVLCRHEAWQRVRDRVAAAPDGDLPPAAELPLDRAAARDHPDLQDVLG